MVGLHLPPLTYQSEYQSGITDTAVRILGT